MQDENTLTPDNSQENEELYPVEPKNQDQPSKSQFFTFNTILSLILLVGLIVLYILFFTAKRSPEPQAHLALQKSGSGSISVAFVNIDSLNEKYDFVKALKNNLESTGRRLQTEVLSEQSNLEKEAADFQRQVSSNSITEERAKIVYEELMQKQQALMDKKERYTRQVADQELDLNLRLLDTVTNFLKRYNKSYGFDYILTFKTGGDILIANDTLDITNDVVKMLNKKYSDGKK